MQIPPKIQCPKKFFKIQGSILGCFVVFTIILMTGFFFYKKTFTPGPLKVSTTLLIPKGTSTAHIARLLAHEKIIDSPHLFHLLSRLNHMPLKAGEYTFYPWISSWEVLKILNEGRVVVHKFRVPEGLSSFEIVAKLNATEALSGYILDLPAEGKLLPNTYFFQYGEDRHTLLNRMEKAMEETLKVLWAGRDPDLPLKSPEEALILASIVEKETGQKDERRRIAAVFLNRLQKGMPLQADPTVIYGLTFGRKILNRSLLRGDLKQETSHNTYLLSRLPPTPICNPGKMALQAVLHPLPTKDLFFVSNGAGGHHFSYTYEKHAKHHNDLRKIRKTFAHP